MARKPRTPNEPIPPIEPEPPIEPVREEEKLPWLQRVEDDEPPSRAGGRWAGYAAGAAVLIIVLVAIGYAIVWRQHAVSTSPEENLASLLPEQLPGGNVQAGNEETAAPSIGESQAGGRAASTAAPRSASSRARPHVSAAAAKHVPSAAPAPAVKPRVHERALEPRRHEQKASEARRQEEAPAPRHHAKLAPPSRPLRERHAVATPRRAFSGPTDLIQLGAYDSRAAAERVWSELSRSRPYSHAAHRVERARVHGHVFYRLRADLPARAWQCVGTRRAPCMVVRWAP